MQVKSFYIMRNVFMVAVPAMVIACGLGNTDNSTLPNGTYNGTATPGLNGAMTSESFTATESGGIYTFVDRPTPSTTIISNGVFTNPITNSPCFTGTLAVGFSSGGSICPINTQIQFTGCSVNNNTSTGVVSFSATFNVLNLNGSGYCYSGGSITMNNYGA